MSKILLLEPNYPAKYPPLGLMKISYYHKFIRKDELVVFAKGQLEEDSQYQDIIWDKVYITTLFTFEWQKTIETIHYAKKLVHDDLSRISVGGIAATLLPDKLETETGIRPVTGLLNQHGKAGFSDIGDLDDAQIDCLPPDYSMLDDVEYKYEYADHYFAYTTRGCGMNCSFCAVKILEPEYVERISITSQVEAIRKLDQANGKKGELRRNLLLLDNNVLRSRRFEEIIEEIKNLGFAKEYNTCINQRTGKRIKRFVDFNQGLDAKLLTQEKANLLGQIALKPARIAFDHIEDKEIYIQAIRYCVNAGITEFSNYTLYNCVESKGKGQEYPADKPEDLYNRLRISVNLKEELNSNKNRRNKIMLYSFPMRYIPLSNTNRGYVGPEWNKKYLRAIQVMLTPTRGKGVSGKSFFEAAFGKDVEQFKKFILMPESILSGRGRIASDKSAVRVSIEQYNDFLMQEWERLWEQLPDKQYFINVIKENKFTPAQFFTLPGAVYKKLYLYYFSNTQMLELFEKAKNADDIKMLKDYITKEARPLLESLVNHIVEARFSYKLLPGYYHCFGRAGINELIVAWINKGVENKSFLKSIETFLAEERNSYVDVESLKIIQAFWALGREDIINEEAKVYVMNMDYQGLWKALENAIVDIDKTLEKKRLEPGFNELHKAFNDIKDRIYGKFFQGVI